MGLVGSLNGKTSRIANVIKPFQKRSFWERSETTSFSTLETIISVAIDGQFIRGQMPPTGKPVIGVMWEPDPIYHRIDNAPCEGYVEITDEQYELLRACIGSNGCKP